MLASVPEEGERCGTAQIARHRFSARLPAVTRLPGNPLVDFNLYANNYFCATEVMDNPPTLLCAATDVNVPVT
jgi:hypothetical protein